MLKRKVESGHAKEEPKKVRTEVHNPSNVLHFRNLPEEVTELEVAHAGIPFGPVAYLVLTRKNGQALIEMESREIAEQMFKYYQEYSPYFRNKRCFVNFSVHTSLQSTKTLMHPEAESAIALANQTYDAMGKESIGPVIRIMVDDWCHEKITSLHFYKIFQHYGTLEKIVMYINKGIVQGFIQYADPFSCRVAKALGNNLSLFPRSCSMRVFFSNRKCLDINREDDMVRDFTRNPVSSDEMRRINFNGNGSDSRHIESYHGSRDTIDALAALQPFLSQAVNYPEDAMPLLRSLAPAIRELLHSSQDFREMSNNNNNYNRDVNNRQSSFGEKISPLLIVSNLNEEKVNPYALFILFGCYGDVTRVKIMYNRKNTALIQFVSADQAKRALQYLNGVNLYGKPIHANFSKHERISHRVVTSEDDSAVDSLHKDYTDHMLHRFRKASSRNHINVFEPCRVLHIAGLVDEVTEEDVEAIFQDHKFRVRKIRMITSNNKKMALVEMINVETAVEALIALHDFDLCGSHLRVSFSKSLVN